jgi:pimeloyl-ACP methyl ester carboxylesterase
MTMRGVQRERPSLYELTKELGELDRPALIVVGDEDEPCLDASLFLKRTLRNAGLSIVPFTGHAVNLEEPDTFNAVCWRFLDSVDRGARPERHALSRRTNVFGFR